MRETRTLEDTSPGRLVTYEEFLHAGKPIASNLDYDLPFIPVEMVISPVCIGMCMVAPAEPGTLLP